MTSSLPVELNREQLREVRVAEEFSVDGPFVLDLSNHGDGVHIHVRMDDALARVATIAEQNQYVEGGTTKQVEVDVRPTDETLTGELYISTGYGSEETTVEVTVEPWEDPSVPVDEELSTPSAEPLDEQSGIDLSTPENWPSLPLLLVAGVAVVVAVALAAAVPSTPVLVGSGVVIGAALAAVAFGFLD